MKPALFNLKDEFYGRLVLALLCFAFFIVVGPALANNGHHKDGHNPTFLQTKDKLKHLDGQIALLKKHLAAVHDKHKLLHQELAKNEKIISLNVMQSRLIEAGMTKKQDQIHALQQQKAGLNQQLEAQEKLLAQQLRVLYQLDTLANPDRLWRQEPSHRQQQLKTYHQYLLDSRKKTMDTIAITREHLTSNEVGLKLTLESQQTNRKKLLENQQQILHNNHYHTAIIQSLDSEIRSKEQALTETERAKQRLSQVLKQISSQKTSYAKVPFSTMQHKLLNPLKSISARIQKTGQGLTFVAKEGSTVYAVYPGKVVFSDWLNGYGLLLILDHGQGYMTLYAHNQSLFKHKGQFISQGEALAAVGHSGGAKVAGLYFEVRKAGKPILPLAWLGT